eukprot:15381278-Alexandrium_andersonii.AAC.1
MHPETLASPIIADGVIATVPMAAARTSGSACAASSCCMCDIWRVRNLHVVAGLHVRECMAQ